MRKLAFGYVKNQDTVTAKLISDFDFVSWIVQSLFSLNLKFPGGCTGWVVTDLVKTPEDRFPHVAALMIII